VITCLLFGTCTESDTSYKLSVIRNKNVDYLLLQGVTCEKTGYSHNT
jgi:hypothetical protein